MDERDIRAWLRQADYEVAKETTQKISMVTHPFQYMQAKKLMLQAEKELNKL